jgi:hypothetical protein
MITPTRARRSGNQDLLIRGYEKDLQGCWPVLVRDGAARSQAAWLGHTKTDAT